MNTLYTIHCPKCEVLKTKLTQKGIEFVENTNVDEMKAKGIETVPYLDTPEGLLNFSQAVKWINEQ